MSFLLRTPKSPFFGKYKGKVEQRVDPKRLGRLKVRILGIHADNTPLDKLPWAEPCISFANQSGEMNIPPLDTWVWVEFKQGDHEYPIWVGGAPGSRTKIEGLGLNEHRVHPTSQFGGKAHQQTSILRLEQVKGVRAQDAPNNYGIVSPLQKRIELDDRNGRERLLLGDHYGNIVATNVEVGVITLEAVCGVQNTSPKAHSITLSTDPQNPGIQLRTFKGWRMLIRDDANKLEVKSPNGEVMLVLSEGKKTAAEMWVGGMSLVMDAASDRISAETSGQASIVLEANTAVVRTHNEESYVALTADMVSVFSKSIELMSSGDLKVQARGRVSIDGTGGVFLNSNKNNPAVLKREQGLDNGDKPEAEEPIKGALDYDFYTKPE